MNKCIFGGQLAKDPTHGLKTKGGNPMVVLTIKMLRKNYEGKWVNDLIEVFAFGNYALWIEKKMRKGMKIIAVCNLKTKLQELQPEVGKTKKRIFYKPFFFLDEFFVTETPELADYAQDRDDTIFSGVLGETMVAAVKQQKNDYDYSKHPRRYRDNNEYPKDEGYYNNMLDNIASNADMGDVEKQGE